MEGIQVIARAAAILREVGAQPDGLSLGKLAQATGLPRSTVQRIVDALETEHLLQAGSGGVRPGWGLRRLGELPGSGIAQELRGALYQLFEATHETIDLSTLSAGEVLFMDRFLSDQVERAVPAIGATYPAYTMASGKALLACLSDNAIGQLYGSAPLHRLTANTVADMAQLLAQVADIRAGAYAYDLEEHAAGKCAIGLPIGLYSGDGRGLARRPSAASGSAAGAVALAISVVVPSARFAAQRPAIEAALSVCARRCREHLAMVG